MDHQVTSIGLASPQGQLNAAVTPEFDAAVEKFLCMFTPGRSTSPSHSESLDRQQSFSGATLRSLAALATHENSFPRNGLRPNITPVFGSQGAEPESPPASNAREYALLGQGTLGKRSSSDGEKHERRKMLNRESARRSRQKQQDRVTELESQLKDMTAARDRALRALQAALEANEQLKADNDVLLKLVQGGPSVTAGLV